MSQSAVAATQAFLETHPLRQPEQRTLLALAHFHNPQTDQVVALQAWLSQRARRANSTVRADIHRFRDRGLVEITPRRARGSGEPGVSYRLLWLHQDVPVQPVTRPAHCRHGHPWDEANTYQRADGCRNCRACDRERKRTGIRQKAAREFKAARLGARQYVGTPLAGLGVSSGSGAKP